MPKKNLIAIIAMVVSLIAASLTLVFTVGLRVSADEYDSYEQTVFKITADYFEIENGEISKLNTTSDMEADFYEIIVPDGVRVLRGHFGEGGASNFVYYGGFSILGEVLAVELPNGLERICLGAFFDMSCLTEIEIPDTVTYIGDYAFSGCGSLNTVKLSNNIKYIGDSAFSSCDNLTTIIIPASVTEMDNYVFGFCNNLTTIYCEAPSQPDGWLPNWKGKCNANVIWGYNATNNQNGNENPNNNNDENNQTENQNNEPENQNQESENNETPNQPETTEKPESKVNVAAIAGGTAGGAVGLGTIGTIVGLAIRKKRRLK